LPLIGAKMLARHLRSGIAILILTRLFHVSFSGLRSGCELALRLIRRDHPITVDLQSCEISEER
jgi:hypothetical protein